VLGCVILAAIYTYLWFTDFGTRHSYDLIVNLNWGRPVEELPELSNALNRHARKLIRASQHASNAGGTDLSYRVLLRDPSRAEELVSELRSLNGVARVFTIAAENESEI
jgi:hypothetical protein